MTGTGLSARSQDDRDTTPGVIRQRVLDPAGSRAGRGRVIRADHDQVGADGIEG